MTNQPTSTLAEALAKLQAELPKVEKSARANTGSYSYTYADLANVSERLLPIMGNLGLSFIARPTLNSEGRFVLAYELLHVSGEKREGQYPLPETGNSQVIGSAITYGRRYCLCAVTGIAPDDDDDDAAAVVQEVKAQEKRQRSAYAPGSERNRPAGSDTKITQAQLTKLHAAMTDYGIGGNRELGLAFISETIGRQIESSKDLTKAEASKVIDRLEREIRQSEQHDGQAT